MPEIICRKGPGKPYTFKLYTPAEIKRTWKIYNRQHLFNVKEGRKYILIDVNDEEDALVLVALIIRKTNSNPPSVHYSKELSKVLVNCEYIGTDFDEMREACRFLTRIYLGNVSLKSIKFDLKGDPLFRNPNQDIESFYQGRNFPNGACSPPPDLTHMTFNGIHEHINPEYAGLI